MASDSKVKLKDPIVKASINTKPQNLSSGIRCVISLSVTIEIKTDDDSVISVRLTGNFVEELKVSFCYDGWAKKEGWWKFVVTTDYFMKADIDIHSFTAVSFEALVYTEGDVNSIDIVAKITDLLGGKEDDKKEITAGVQDLYELYTDMMENESDFIEIFNQTIVEKSYSLLKGAIQIKFQVSFIVSGDINVAIGCNYESKEAVRYSYWAWLIDESSGASSVDLMKKEYSFQFYVMGRLGLRVGIKPELLTGIINTDYNSIGLEAESGIYINAYGFFFYEKLHKNNNKTTKSGALYYELGSYLDMALVAQAGKGKVKASKDLIGRQTPILSAGTRYYIYDFAYEDTEDIVFNSNSKTYTVPIDTFKMINLDLREGEISIKTQKIGDYEVKFSDKRFTLKDGKITANVPSDIKYLVVEMTIIWKQGALAFSSVPISRTYKLVWDTLKKDGYTISFDSNGGSTVKSITKKYNEKVTAPKNPTRTGYTFAGWYTDTALKQAYTFSTMGWDNVKLYAKWTPKTNTMYRVEHYQQDITNCKKYTLKDTENLTGTTGANVSPAVKTYAGFVSPSKKDVTIAADGSTVVEYRYTRNSYTVTFVPYNGSDNIVQTLKYGATIKPPALSKTGHTFTGWDKTVAKTMPANNLAYEANWEKNTYSVSFDSNGGENPASITVTYGEKYGELPEPKREGYTFLGWYTSEVDNVGYGTLIDENTIVSTTSAQILYAKWSGNPKTPYTIKHYQENIDGIRYIIIFGKEIPIGIAATLKEEENRTGTAGTEVTPEVKNYAGFTSPNKKTVTIGGDGKTVVEYYYTRNKYKLTFKSENGNKDIVTTVKYGAPITVPEVTREGYTFDGWTPEPETTMPAEDTIYTAKWTANPYTVTFDSNGGSVCEDYIVTFDSPYGDLPAPTRTEYVFAGWYDSETDDNGSGTEITSSTTVSTAENHVLYAKWNSTEAPTEPEVMVYKLSLEDGKIEIYPDRFIQNGVMTEFDNKTSKFIISDECVGDTPLHIFNDTESPVVYDITLQNTVISGGEWATAVRIDYDGVAETGNPDNIIINFTIDGVVKFSGHTHSGLQTNGQVTVNLIGTAGSSFYCEDRYRYNETWVAVGSKINLKVISENYTMKVGGNVTTNIKDASGPYSSPLEITFK